MTSCEVYLLFFDFILLLYYSRASRDFFEVAKECSFDDASHYGGQTFIKIRTSAYNSKLAAAHLSTPMLITRYCKVQFSNSAV